MAGSLEVWDEDPEPCVWIEPSGAFLDFASLMFCDDSFEVKLDIHDFFGGVLASAPAVGVA